MDEKGELEIRRVMIDLMADRLTTDYHDKEWVIKYWRGIAKSIIEQSRRKNGNESND